MRETTSVVCMYTSLLLVSVYAPVGVGVSVILRSVDSYQSVWSTLAGYIFPYVLTHRHIHFLLYFFSVFEGVLCMCVSEPIGLD